MPGTVRTVLIVDDAERTRAALRTFIETRTPFHVCGEASNGVEALEMANRDKPDVVLMDLLMPLANGVESASAIRARLPKTRVVLITLFPELVSKSLAKSAGIDAVIDKTKCATTLRDVFQTFFRDSQPPALAS